jgi:hypothetical protein
VSRRARLASLSLTLLGISLFTGVWAPVVRKCWRRGALRIAEVFAASLFAADAPFADGPNYSPPDTNSWQSGELIALGGSNQLPHRWLRQKWRGEKFALQGPYLAGSFAHLHSGTGCSLGLYLTDCNAREKPGKNSGAFERNFENSSQWEHVVADRREQAQRFGPRSDVAIEIMRPKRSCSTRSIPAGLFEISPSWPSAW